MEKKDLTIFKISHISCKWRPKKQCICLNEGSCNFLKFDKKNARPSKKSRNLVRIFLKLKMLNFVVISCSQFLFFFKSWMD